MLTHCDTTTAFKAIGKVEPIRVPQKHPQLQPVQVELGRQLEITEKLLKDWKSAHIHLMKFKSVNNLRFNFTNEKCGDDHMLQIGCNVDLDTLPLYRGALHQHIWRVNYQGAKRREELMTMDGHYDLVLTFKIAV
jgi:hypothetical protein